LGRFQQFQMGQAMTQAASNPAGGGAADGMGMGMGFAMAHQMAQQFGGGAGAGAGAPPPPPSAALFHVTKDGQTFGPFGAAQLAEQVRLGQLNRQTLVWSAGMAGWTEAGQVAALAVLFGPPAPPPPPPAAT
jgi:membrane protease subunit (stomatin/prohibitin family)